MMGRRRGFLPPLLCQPCGKPPHLGQSLWPGEKWRCIACLEEDVPGKDALSKSMNKMIEYTDEMNEVFYFEAKGLNAEGSRNRAEWARMMAAEIRKQGIARTKDIVVANGEAVPPSTETFLRDTLTSPDLTSVQASLDRNRLLLQHGMDVAAMALDASTSIKAENSLEKMLAHQLAVAHTEAMEQIGRAHHAHDLKTEVARLNAATRCMTVFQQGLLALQKMRQGGKQVITVQNVCVSEGGQAVIGNVGPHGTERV